MTPTRTVLAHDPNEPICTSCAKGLGMRPLDKLATQSVQTCCLCATAAPCMAIRDYARPAGQRRPVHAQPDDYSELENLLGGRR